MSVAAGDGADGRGGVSSAWTDPFGAFLVKNHRNKLTFYERYIIFYLRNGKRCCIMVNTWPDLFSGATNCLNERGRMHEKDRSDPFIHSAAVKPVRLQGKEV